MKHGSCDSELLEAFVAQRDNDAFQELVARHENMVWSVCRRHLMDDGEADDALQIAFLTLIKHGYKIRHRDYTAWLYRLAISRCVSLSR